MSFLKWQLDLHLNILKRKVDIAIIEVGMGGRLDATNIITPLISVITNIGLDHSF
jgi:dihydrofolate synthase/folylpolyglutamate synthase